LNGFFTQLSDLKQGDEDTFSRVPSWVPIAIIGTVIVFSSFTTIQIRYQWLSPDYYWKTGTSPASIHTPHSQLTPPVFMPAELWYCLLSLTAKVFLGGILLINVLAFASVQEALADTPAARAMIPPPSPPPPVA